MTPTPDEILSRLSEIEAREAKATKGPWRSMREGNQYIGVELNPRLGRSAAGPRASKLVGASRIEGIERPWNPWWVGDPYSPKTEETVRLTDEDADFVAASRSDIPWLVSTVRELVAERDEWEKQAQHENAELAKVKAEAETFAIRAAHPTQDDIEAAAIRIAKATHSGGPFDWGQYSEIAKDYRRTMARAALGGEG